MISSTQKEPYAYTDNGDPDHLYCLIRAFIALDTVLVNRLED